MRSNLALLLLATSIACGGQPSATSTAAPEPAVAAEPTPPAAFVPLGNTPESAVFKPRFDTSEGAVEAGTAFVIAANGDTPALLLTAHHLFGEAGGMSRDYRWDELTSVVTGASGRNPWDVKLGVRTGPPLAIEGAAALSPEGVDLDLAAFPLAAESRAHAMKLTTRRPELGEQVWLVGTVIGGSPEQARHPARVLEVSDGHLAYVFQPAIELRATSGAPVVDADGAVVAINLGGGELESGEVFGLGNPAWSVAPRLARAGSGDATAAALPAACDANIVAQAQSQGGFCLEEAVVGADKVATCRRHFEGLGWRPDPEVAAAIGGKSGKQLTCFRRPR